MLNSLRSRIYIGFAIIASLLVVLGLIGHYGTRRLHVASNAMRDVSDVNAVVLEVDRDVQELQLRVGRYVTSGGVALQNEIITLNDHLVLLIEDTANDQTEPEMRDLFDRMSEHLPEYRKQFESVIKERQIRADLVQNQLPNQSLVIHNKLSRLKLMIEDDEQANEIRVSLLRCESMFSQAEKLLLRYYVAPDTTFVNLAIEHLEEAALSLKDIKSHDESETLRQDLIAELERYQRVGVRAVQATRSYLFLVNVVMAGEASEVTYYSDRLRELSKQRHDRLSAEAASMTANIRRITGTGITVALLLSLVIAGRLAMRIVQPIAAITHTFKRLAAGESVTSIPESNRDDEIGQMAMAAGVFNDQNRKQKLLLEESNRLADELAAKAEELKQINGDLDRFAYAASHDLKSPLRGIRQLASWIDEDHGHLLPEESLKHFRAIQTRIGRMELLLDDLLSFSRIGRTEDSAEMVNLSAMLQDIVEITDNPKEVSIQWNPDLPEFRTYRIPLEQVLLNLIGNAIKHNDKGRLGLVEVLCEQHKDFITFSIRDNGPGIEPQHHERVFRMYQRVGSPNVDGSGMGLAIVKKQVERLGGRIQLECNPDQGVTFRFEWPVLSPQKQTVETCPIAVPQC